MGGYINNIRLNANDTNTETKITNNVMFHHHLMGIHNDSHANMLPSSVSRWFMKLVPVSTTRFINGGKIDFPWNRTISGIYVCVCNMEEVTDMISMADQSNMVEAKQIYVLKTNYREWG